MGTPKVVGSSFFKENAEMKFFSTNQRERKEDKGRKKKVNGPQEPDNARRNDAPS